MYLCTYVCVHGRIACATPARKCLLKVENLSARNLNPQEGLEPAQKWNKRPLHTLDNKLCISLMSGLNCRQMVLRAHY